MTDDNKISELYQHTKKQKPPMHLDDAILNMAKDAVQADNGASKVKGPFSGGWPISVSIAAVLVITVILVPLLQQEEFSPAEKNIMDESEQAIVRQDSVKQKVYTERLNSERIEAKKESKQRKLVLDKRQQSEPKFVRPSVVEASSSMAQMRSKPEALPMLMSAPVPSKESALSTQSGTADNMATNLSQEVLKPHEWLAEIRTLINQNKLEQARDELIKFKQHYPDEEIDESIFDQF